jgi:hypothetical protein
LAASSAFAASLHGQPVAKITAVKVIPGDGETIIAVDGSAPLKPDVDIVEEPLRLVIDFPDSSLDTLKKRIPFRNPQIKAVRMNQYQASPPVSRIVVDLAAPVRYSWDALGNRINIRVRPDDSSSAKPLTAPAATPGVQPAAVPYAEGSTGTLVEAGSRVGSGSSITAKEDTAVLRLSRGGEVRVCPGTTVSVATSPNGQDLMLGMGTGSIETHYHIEESSDSVLTPDFRIVLPGPGEFNLAIRADSRGDTCVSSQPGSTSSVVVAELLGTATYEVKPLQGVVFRGGQMQSVQAPLSTCGCPPPAVPILEASAKSPAPVHEEQVSSALELARPDDPSAPVPAAEASLGPAAVPADPTPEAKGEQLKAQLATPLVFSGKERAKLKSSSAQSPLVAAAALPLSPRQRDPMPALVVLPPPPEPKPHNKGFFGRIKGFLGSIL